MASAHCALGVAGTTGSEVWRISKIAVVLGAKRLRAETERERVSRIEDFHDEEGARTGRWNWWQDRARRLWSDGVSARVSCYQLSLCKHHQTGHATVGAGVVQMVSCEKCCTSVALVLEPFFPRANALAKSRRAHGKPAKTCSEPAVGCMDTSSRQETACGDDAAIMVRRCTRARLTARGTSGASICRHVKTQSNICSSPRPRPHDDG